MDGMTFLDVISLLVSSLCCSRTASLTFFIYINNSIIVDLAENF